MDMNLNDLIAHLNRNLPGWWWIVRSDDGMFFAQVGKGKTYEVGVTCFPSWAATPEMAMEMSINGALMDSVSSKDS